MKTLNTYFETEKQFTLFVQENAVQDQNNLLVQVFTSELDVSHILSIRDAILRALPCAKIIGTTTDGEINNTQISTTKTVVSITVFESSEVGTFFCEESESSFLTGQKLAKKALHDDTKVMITFSDGLHTNGEELLLGIESVNSDVVIAGGMAGDGARFENTFVFTEKEFSSRGAVCAVINAKELHVFNTYSYNWEKIGVPLTITKVDKNRVYEINNQSPVEIYRHYLGDDAADSLPAIGIEFPLVIERDGIEISRAVLGKEDDGSLIFAGNLTEGDIVHFGFGNVEMILNASSTFEDEVAKHSVESIFVYSCMARRRFLQNDVKYEISPLAKMAPTSGFFTYGEFFKADKVALLNQTMTILALSESTHEVCARHSNYKREVSSLVQTQKALTHLVNTTSTEVKKLNDNLEDTIAKKTKDLEDTILELQLATKVKSEFLANMSHELRTPLNAITGFLTLLQHGEKDPERLKKFEIIDKASQNLMDIISDILDITKIESGELELEYSVFDMNELIEDTFSLFLARASSEEITMRLHSSSLPKTFVSDPLRIKQVLSNLLSNAIKFTPRGNSIDFNVTCDNEKKILHIDVVDTGCGIQKKNLEHIFQVFSQADSSSTREYGGTGLGLSISNQLAHLLGGSIEVISEVGKGSTFSFLVPCVEEETKEVDNETAESTLELKGHVLVAEDNHSNQMLMELLLEEYGVTCDIAEDGLIACEYFKHNSYNMILMDENMPNLSGSEATKLIREYEQNNNLERTPIVACTANALKGDRERFIAIGMDDYISKPIHYDLLKEMLVRYLKQ